MRREVDPDIYCPQAALIDEETARKAELRLAKYRARVEAAKQFQKEQQMMALQRQQQQQRMWMVGGAFVVIAVSYIWYKRNGQRRSKRNDIENNLPRDLFLEGDDECTEEELQQVFDEAAKVARQFPNGMLDQRDQLMLYGLYKQANEGDRGDDNAVSLRSPNVGS